MIIEQTLLSSIAYIFMFVSQFIDSFMVSQSLQMSQPKKQGSRLTQRISNNSTRNKTIVLSNQQNPFIKRAQLGKILEPFALKEQQLLSQIAQLQNKNKQLTNLLSTQKQEYERSRHLLSIKEQVCKAQQKQIEQLKNCYKKNHHSKTNVDLHHSNLNYDLNQISKIQNVEGEDYDSQEEKQNRQYQTKRKICLKKSMKPKNSLNSKVDSLEQTQNIQIARLKSEIGNLQQMIGSLHIQIQMLQIQNQSIVKDSQITNKRQRRLYESYTGLLRETNKQREQEQANLNKKCLMLEKCIDKLTEKVNHQTGKAQECPQLLPLPRKNQEFHPPITPHFSSNAFVFPSEYKKTPSKMDFIPRDEIFQTISSEPDNQ